VSLTQRLSSFKLWRLSPKDQNAKIRGLRKYSPGDQRVGAGQNTSKDIRMTAMWAAVRPGMRYTIEYLGDPSRRMEDGVLDLTRDLLPRK